MIRIKKAKKDKGVRFLLQPRPQRDPLAADFEAPQHVLIPKDGTDIDKIQEKLPDFDSSLFVSKDETKRGMLERAHDVTNSLDPDILNAMSKDFDFEDPNNVLDDDFMDQAGGLIEEDGGELLFEDADEYDLDLDLDQDDVNQHHKDEEEDDDGRLSQATKSAFTNYSMTSSVVRRTQGLQQIDEHFERLYVNEYADDTEIGPLDLNEVKGEQLLTNLDQIRQLKDEIKVVRQQNHVDDYEPELIGDYHKNAIIGDDPDEEEEDLVEIEFKKRENRVDCESVLTYNSNLYNHPKLIIEPRTRSRNLSKMEIDDDRAPAPSVVSSRVSVLSNLSIRPPNETPEERQVRKKALKAYRHQRRQERKQNQQIFKKEQANLLKQQRTRQTALKL